MANLTGRSAPKRAGVRGDSEGAKNVDRFETDWRLIPSDFPPWRTVYEYQMAWRKTGVLRKIHQLLVKARALMR